MATTYMSLSLFEHEICRLPYINHTETTIYGATKYKKKISNHSKSNLREIIHFNNVFMTCHVFPIIHYLHTSYFCYFFLFLVFLLLLFHCMQLLFSSDYNVLQFSTHFHGKTSEESFVLLLMLISDNLVARKVFFLFCFSLFLGENFLLFRNQQKCVSSFLGGRFLCSKVMIFFVVMMNHANFTTD